MPFVTTLRLSSGDRAVLEDVVSDVKRAAERKGVEFRGPHASPPASYRVPLYRRPAGRAGRFPPWEYTVYERVFDFTGPDETIRRLTDRTFPRAVHVELTVDQVRSVGSR